ncbi:TPA: hypothetical protein RQN04_002027 [Aeromonas hydrophila]|nr:hypothetical protein [Aeromonas hydrophila]
MSKAMMGNPFDPLLPLVVTFTNGSPAVLLDCLESAAPGVWYSPAVKGYVFNDRGVQVADENGRLMQPHQAMACNTDYRARIQREGGGREPAPEEIERELMLERHMGWRKGTKYDAADRDMVERVRNRVHPKPAPAIKPDKPKPEPVPATSSGDFTW